MKNSKNWTSHNATCCMYRDWVCGNVITKTNVPLCYIIFKFSMKHLCTRPKKYIFPLRCCCCLFCYSGSQILSIRFPYTSNHTHLSYINTSSFNFFSHTCSFVLLEYLHTNLIAVCAYLVLIFRLRLLVVISILLTSKVK